MDNPNETEKKDHMQSDIFHQNNTNKRDFNKVNEEKHKIKEMDKVNVNFDVNSCNNDTQTLKQKNLRSTFDHESHDMNLDIDKLQQGTDKMKGWKEINDSS